MLDVIELGGVECGMFNDNLIGGVAIYLLGVESQ